MNWQEFKKEKILFDKSISAIATKVLRHNNIETAPIDVERIIALFGIHLHFKPDIDYFGSSDRSTNIIEINSNSSKIRQKFTMAHELGHILLHNFTDKHIDKEFVNKNEIKAEYEANKFAGCLLMPLWMLEPLITHGGVKNAEKLAELFEVSGNALEMQLRYLMGEKSWGV